MLNQSSQTEHGNASTVESHRHARGGSSNPSFMGRLTTRVAILGVFLHLKVKCTFCFSVSFLYATLDNPST